jgi:argininosuccinate lyase
MRAEQIVMRDGEQFPGTSYVDVVLRPAYDAAKSVLLPHMMEIHRAHLVMLRETGIITATDAAMIARGLDDLDLDAIATSSYTGEYEDLFFVVEARLLELVGPAAGNLHIARSRNDMGMTLDRMAMRPKLLDVLRAANELHETLVLRAQEFASALVLEHTHTQQAQPSVAGHRWLAIADVLARDISRVQGAYTNLNHCPLGAAALGGTGFPIDRNRTAALLGFPALIENSYDAVAGTDYLAHAAIAMQLMAVNLGRTCVDFLTWLTAEFGHYRVAAPYVQISSIMPQKRNPVSVEHSRALLSTVGAMCQTVLTMMHNTSFGDINDTEDDMQPHIWRATDTLAGVLRLLTGVLGTLSANTGLMRERALASFASTTELADTLTRETSLTFKEAHSTVSELVRRAQRSAVTDVRSLDPRWVSEIASAVTGRPIEVPAELVRRALDAQHFVDVRTSIGGVAPAEVLRMAEDRATLGLVEWVDREETSLSVAHDAVRHAVDRLVACAQDPSAES